MAQHETLKKAQRSHQQSVYLFINSSWPVQDQAGDPQLVSEVHPRRAGALLQGPEGHLFPLRPPDPRHPGRGGLWPAGLTCYLLVLERRYSMDKRGNKSRVSRGGRSEERRVGKEC